MTEIAPDLINPHEPGPECGDTHCWSHGVDESDAGAWRVCFECGHVYRTPEELRREWTASAPPEMRDLDAPPAGDIDFCALCMHTFSFPPLAGDQDPDAGALDLRSVAVRPPHLPVSLDRPCLHACLVPVVLPCRPARCPCYRCLCRGPAAVERDHRRAGPPGRRQGGETRRWRQPESE